MSSYKTILIISDLSKELEIANRRREEAENLVNNLNLQLDRLRSSQSPGSRREDTSLEMRAQIAERKLAEFDQKYQKLEDEHQTAVHYVK